jgi:hypothetical protein
METAKHAAAAGHGDGTGADTERTALKEWAIIVDAMARGTLIAMVRKGGIRERRAGFAVRHQRFLLYPTYFHENQDELAPQLRSTLGADQPPPSLASAHVRLTCVARVARVWTATALEPLRAIAAEHGLAWPAVESRFRYRDTPRVHVVAVRVARLRGPVDLPELPRYGGCVSWVELGQDVDVSGAEPVLTDREFDRRLAALQRALDGFQHD